MQNKQINQNVVATLCVFCMFGYLTFFGSFVFPFGMVLWLTSRVWGSCVGFVFFDLYFGWITFCFDFDLVSLHILSIFFIFKETFGYFLCGMFRRLWMKDFPDNDNRILFNSCEVLNWVHILWNFQDTDFL